MKNLCLLILLSLLFVFIGCGDDDMDGVGPGGGDNAPIVLDCRFDDDMTLSNHNPDGVDYIIDCGLEVYGGLLTIQPGTHIQMNAGATIEIDLEGAMSAVGNSDSPILFSGADGGTAASWGYIYFNTNDADNRLDHVIIETGVPKIFCFSTVLPWLWRVYSP